MRFFVDFTDSKRTLVRTEEFSTIYAALYYMEQFSNNIEINQINLINFINLLASTGKSTFATCAGRMFMTGYCTLGGKDETV